jgi:hypothetical protein
MIRMFTSTVFQLFSSEFSRVLRAYLELLPLEKP